MNKKVVRFEIQDLLPIGLTLVVAGIGLVYGLNVMGDISSSTKVLSTTSVLNESVASGSSVSQGALFVSASACRNASSIPLDLNLYCNVSSTGGVIVAPGNASGNVFIDYSHYTPSTAYNASIDAIKGVAKIPEKMPLIATVIVASIIIGILVRYLMVRFT